jgi:hypothetical protein
MIARGIRVGKYIDPASLTVTDNAKFITTGAAQLWDHGLQNRHSDCLLREFMKRGSTLCREDVLDGICVCSYIEPSAG